MKVGKVTMRRLNNSNPLPAIIFPPYSLLKISVDPITMWSPCYPRCQTGLSSAEEKANTVLFSSLVQYSPSSDSVEDLDLSDAVLDYINHVLMEEDADDRASTLRDSPALQAAERSLYDVIGQQYPLPDQPSIETNSLDSPDLDEDIILCPDWIFDPDFDRCPIDSGCRSSCSSSSSSGATRISSGINQTAGAEKIFPSGSNFTFRSPNPILTVDTRFESRGKKNPYSDESVGPGDERSSKVSAVCSESTVSPEMFDEVLLTSPKKNESKTTTTTTTSSTNNHDGRQPKGRKNRAKKRASNKRIVVDLTNLLTLCAQSIAADDHTSAREFLTRIRNHSSPSGDGTQRLAHYFADCLEARISGGPHVRTSFDNLPATAAAALRAYHLYLSTCPFRKVSNFFANRAIANASGKATRLHVIDFGITYGFQWPCFLERLSARPGGPPSLRITGIDLPCRGFRPSERVEETGRRLVGYAEVFRVPFEFNAIARKWETITLEDLKIDADEVLVVNSLFRMRSLADETVVEEESPSPRDGVLNLVRRMNPALFVLGIMNGAHGGPFFRPRFREAMFHYSALFDMLDVNVGPDVVHERVLLERGVFGRQAMNVIACEGCERVERPETYRKWQARMVRAGFEQIPLDREIMGMAREKVESCYHKDFLVDEDGDWMLQGWRGRVLYALSSWRPACCDNGLKGTVWEKEMGKCIFCSIHLEKVKDCKFHNRKFSGLVFK
ncbi:GRAS family transcription factor [Striga asiatica]|uniref:GRAS family transcription factor n=1 Tax=Striga asiatica TaxID=4170 RepID=A0A5A7PQR8_STRAF|nr:GRAS family transcription factor [Striga asiatica]